MVQTSLGGFEPSTYGLEGRCSIQLSYRLISLTTPKTNCFRKAGDGNRTHVSSLEGWCSTIELHPHVVGVTGFEPATSWSQTRRSSQAEPHPDGVVLYHFLLPLRDTRHIIYECQLNVNNFFHFFIFSSSSPETLEIQGFSGLSLYGFRYSCVISIFPLSSICMSI